MSDKEDALRLAGLVQQDGGERALESDLIEFRASN
jgi:hypothetical protein